jgi:hypothetical protein
MHLHPILFGFFRFLLPACIVATSYLYLYPIFNGCAFPSPTKFNEKKGPDTCIFESKPDNLFDDHDAISKAPPFPPIPQVAPLRLLALADPQLEGDTSLPKAPNATIAALEFAWFSLSNGNLRHAVDGSLRVLREIFPDLVRGVRYARKQIDLLGNDYYLAHVYRSVHWWTAPTHVTVLGDLLGSQWIGDKEFEHRSWRYWNRVLKRGKKTETELLHPENYDTVGPRKETLGADPSWNQRIINIAGNHDIGYAGDINQNRIDRFEEQFGPVNGDIIFTLPNTTSIQDPTIRILVLNSMNLDLPALSEDLQVSTFQFINDAISHSAPVESHTHFTILLTHIPLHKSHGVCVDSPLFQFFSDSEGGGIKEQNMLSADLSRDAVLQGLFGKHPNLDVAARGMGRDGIILTGHDHEGCDVYHYAERAASNSEENEGGGWKVAHWSSAEAWQRLTDDDTPGVREVTVRSMMGEFGGNAVLLSAWWDDESMRWRYEVSRCILGVQHIWWGVHILDVVTVLFGIVAVILYFQETRNSRQEKEGRLKGSKDHKDQSRFDLDGNDANGCLGKADDMVTKIPLRKE